jgi:hypothetical protein
MTISVCPVAKVEAPLERVWALLMAPESYSEWWDARTEHVEPPGAAAPGQVVRASSRALGRRWPVTTRVEAVDAARHALDLRTTLPLGIVVANHILVQPLDARSCRVSFG